MKPTTPNCLGTVGAGSVGCRILVLNALTDCINAYLVYHAAARGYLAGEDQPNISASRISGTDFVARVGVVAPGVQRNGF